jgi:hypothetical protein
MRNSTCLLVEEYRADFSCIAPFCVVNTNLVGALGGTETQGGVNNAGAMGIYDPSFAYGASQPWWQTGAGVVGKGLKSFGGSVQSSPVPQFGTPKVPSGEVQYQQPGQIQQPQQAQGEQQGINIEALLRLLLQG